MSHFEGADFDQFISHFNLHDLRDILVVEFGATSMDDLKYMYCSSALIQQLIDFKEEGKVKLLAYKRFINAAKQSTYFDGSELCSIVVGTAVEPVPLSPPPVPIPASKPAVKPARNDNKHEDNKKELEKLKLASATLDTVLAETSIERRSVHSEIVTTVKQKRKIKEAKRKEAEEIKVVVCKICMEYHPISNGITCCNNHFTCWGDLQEYINHAGGVDVVGKFTDKTGNLLCSDCSEPYDLFTVSNKAAFDSMSNLKVTLNSRIAANGATLIEHKRMKKEQERIQLLSAEEREIEYARCDIIENILTLSCPRCHAAFLDFEGCFALWCHMTTCKAGICAWCLADCGTDAHPHVLVCPENTVGGHHGGSEVFNAHHKKRRHRLSLQKIAILSPSQQVKLKDRMRKDFSDLGIDIDSSVV